MNITATAVAVTLAVVIAGAFLFFGPAVLRPFQPQTTTTASGDVASTTTLTMNDSTQPGAPAASGALSANPAAGLPAQLPTTLAMRDEAVGTGPAVKAGDVVTVQYVGALPDGTVFDASSKHQETASGFSFKVGAGQVIKGWDQGLVGMQVGGKRLLIIPPDMGYGAQGAGSVIPPNATLVFEVQLVKIGQ